MTSEEHERTVDRALAGDATALASAFEIHRPRLEVMIRYRLDPRLRGRLDVADVLQESFLRASEELPKFAEKQALPFFIWLRSVTAQTLWRLHRHHLGAGMRDAGLEVSLDGNRRPQASGFALASKLAGSWTSPSGHAMREEVNALLVDTLSELEPLDREILTLRHLEELSNKEAALELSVEEGTARKRHRRALERLRQALDSIPGLF